MHFIILIIHDASLNAMMDAACKREKTILPTAEVHHKQQGSISIASFIFVTPSRRVRTDIHQ